MWITTNIWWLWFTMLKKVWNPKLPYIRLIHKGKVLYQWEANSNDNKISVIFEEPIQLKCWEQYQVEIDNIWIMLQWRKKIYKREQLEHLL